MCAWRTARQRQQWLWWMNWKGLRPGVSVRWAMATDASIAVEGSAAVLTQAGRKLHVAFAAPADLRLESVSIKNPEGEWNADNPGKRMLTAHGRADPTVA